MNGRRNIFTGCQLIMFELYNGRERSSVYVVIIIIITTTVFVVLSSWPKSLWEFTRFIWVPGGSPQTKPIDLGCESFENLATTIHIHHCHCYYYSACRLSFYRPMKGGRLSRPRHCSKGAQPVPKAVYRSSCHNKHNRPWCDLNLGPLTLQSDTLTTRLLRPAWCSSYHQRYFAFAKSCNWGCRLIQVELYNGHEMVVYLSML